MPGATVGPDLEALLVRWINELVFLIQDDGFVPVSAALRIWQASEGGFSLKARLIGASLDLEGYGPISEMSMRSNVLRSSRFRLRCAGYTRASR